MQCISRLKAFDAVLPKIREGGLFNRARLYWKQNNRLCERNNAKKRLTKVFLNGIIRTKHMIKAMKRIAQNAGFAERECLLKIPMKAFGAVVSELQAERFGQSLYVI